MSDQITTELESRAEIKTADSWPTGLQNEGPEEYGITHNFTDEAALRLLESLLLEHDMSGFYLESTTDVSETEYDVMVAVYRHPLSALLTRTLETLDTVTGYGLDWSVNSIEDCYIDNKLDSPGTLKTWFETSDNDYDRVLKHLEDKIADWNTTADATAGIEVYGSDSDRCHIGLTFTLDFATLLTAEYDLSPKPVWDDAGQTTGHIYYDGDWLVSEIYISRFTGEAIINNTTYDPDNPSDVESFRTHVRNNYREHTYVAPFKGETDEVTVGLESTDSIENAHTWCGNEYPGDNAYAISYDTTALSEEEVTERVSEMLDAIEYYPFTLHDYTSLYTNHEYDLILVATFQLS